MNSQAVHLIHESILCVQITSGRADFLTETPQWKVLAGTKCWAFDLPTQIFFDLQSYLTYIFMAPHSQASLKWPVLWGPLCWSRQQTIQSSVYTYPEPVLLERVCCRSAWLTYFGNWVQLWLAAPGVPNGLPSKNYPGPMLLNLHWRSKLENVFVGN